MSNIFTFGEGLLDAVKSSTSVAVVISEGGYQTEELPATVFANRRFDEVTGQLVSAGWITAQLSADDLVLNGQTLEPREGMRISVHQGPYIGVYEIAKPNTADPHFDWQGISRTRLVMHARLVKTK